MIQKTKDFSQFTLREDNRAQINNTHVKRIAESIKQRNLLEFRPIVCNAQMEIIDGQHRFLAAKMLGTEIYYTINKELVASDIILLNNAKSWGIGDYLNYYCKNGYEDYQKFKEFCDKNNVRTKIAYDIMNGQSDKSYDKFKNGQFKFNVGEYANCIQECFETIATLKRLNGYSRYTDSCRFWSALMKLIKSVSFNMDKWISNIEKMPDRFGPRATHEDYLKLMQQVYNWHNENKVQLLEAV